jgi:AcrR family transcriptional regulator
MITVSTSISPARAYHHGDLRSALVEAGMEALKTTAIADLSLRQLARDVGVSATAVYRHFPDKQALMRALASEGIEQLGQFQQAAADGAANSADAFAATGRAYVRFALAHPALFRLMFSQCEPIGVSIFGENLAARMLQDKAAVATAIARPAVEPISPGPQHRMGIGRLHPVQPHQRADQHEQGRSRQVEVGHQAVDGAEAIAGGDEDRGVAASNGWITPSSPTSRFPAGAGWWCRPRSGGRRRRARR